MGNNSQKRADVQKTGLKSKILDRVKELFYEYPNEEFTIREIEKRINIPRATLANYLKELKKEKMIDDKNSASANLLFKTRKINYFIEKIVSSGLAEEIIKKLNPLCIIIFGSIRKGDSVKDSDIDIFIESAVKKEINLKMYEKKLGHKIQLFIESDINKLPVNLFNNVVNGIKIYGSFKIK